MIRTKTIPAALLFLSLFIACRVTAPDSVKSENKVGHVEKPWMLGPFERPDNAKPIIRNDTSTFFKDPMSGKRVAWQSKATFNPAAVVRDHKINVLYRAEQDRHTDTLGGHTSRIGLAVSDDGINYHTEKAPIFYPDNDDQKKYEWIGGTEDPRIVQSGDGKYILTYTQWNGDVPRLALATSPDLRKWTKHGPIFEKYKKGKYNHRETKSGAIVTELKNGKLVAAKINGKYYHVLRGTPYLAGLVPGFD